MFKKLFLVFLLMLIMSGCFENCDNPTIPSSPREYRDQVGVTYVRDISKILTPQASDRATDIRYRLFDPDTKDPDFDESEYIEDNYRIGVVDTDKIGENIFQGYIKHVFIQTSPNHPKHQIYIRDIKLYDGIREESTFTPYGITIQGAYDLKIKGYWLYFQMSKN